MKDLTSSNSQFRDQNCCSSLRKLLCLFFCLLLFFNSYYYLFTCFSIAINEFCDLNSALSLLVQNTRNPQNPFSSQSRTCYTLPELNRYGWIHTMSYIVPMQFLFKWSTRYIPRSIWYTFVFGHLPISVTVLSNLHFPTSRWQLHKVSKNNNDKLFSCK